jgi:hypothetical protein
VPTLLLVVIPASENKTDIVRQSTRRNVKQHRRQRIRARRGTRLGETGSNQRRSGRVSENRENTQLCSDGWM